MHNASLLIVAMAERCRELIEKSLQTRANLPRAIHPNHLLWMCYRIEEQAENWSVTKLHRWIGFIQCGMLAHHMLDFNDARTMFDEAKATYGTIDGDEDLLDHLDSANPFELDIGGQG